MIRRLRRRMTLLVLLAVALVTVGMVVTISSVNYNGIDRQAGQTLAALIANGGRRFSGPIKPRSDGANGQTKTERLKESDEDSEYEGRQPNGHIPRGGRRGRSLFDGISEEETASLSNTFTANLNEDGTLFSWESDRADLWDEEEVRAICLEAATAESESGRIGSRYYLKGTRGSRPILVVLDARLELENARRVTLISAGVGAVSCFLLGIGAWLLVRRMTYPVEEAFRRQQHFVQDAGHEMKTPLAIISSHAQVLEGEYGESESLSAILDEVKRTSGLVSQLLALSKLDRDEEALRRQTFDLSHTALEAALSFESAAFEAGFSIETDANEPVFAQGDETMTRRLLMILLDNAVKYGNPESSIRVSTRKRRKNALLSVENVGEDIPAEAIPHLFERFYRADTAHSRGKDGSGLGLSIAQELAHAMNGEISCESSGGKTVFTLVLTAK